MMWTIIRAYFHHLYGLCHGNCLQFSRNGGVNQDQGSIYQGLSGLCGVLAKSHSNSHRLGNLSSFVSRASDLSRKIIPNCGLIFDRGQRLRLDGVDLRENQYLMKQLHQAAQKQDVARIHCPISLNLLLQILKRVDLVVRSDFESHLFKAIFSTAYHGMFRIGELVHSQHALKLANVLQEAEGEAFHCIQHSSKVLRPGQMPPVIVIEPLECLQEFCPCRILFQFAVQRAQVFGIHHQPESQFFLQENGRKVSKELVLRRVRQCVHLIPNFVATEFGTHSFRSGKATDLFKVGMTDAEIMELGRWTSETFRRYIRV